MSTEPQDSRISGVSRDGQEAQPWRAWRRLIGLTPLGGPRVVASITMECGFVKVLLTRGTEVLDFRTSLANPQFFREGLVGEGNRVAEIVRNALAEIGAKPHLTVTAVPGYQTTLGQIELPTAEGVDPEVVIHREALRVLGVPPESSQLAWHPLSGRQGRTSWLVVSATRRSMASLLGTLEAAEASADGVELRAFALARAVNLADAVIAWAAADGCEVAVVRGWTPVTHQCAYWGPEPVDRAVLVDRMTTVVERTVSQYDESGHGMPLTASTPLCVTGSPTAFDEEIASQIGANVSRPVEHPRPALLLPSDFPLNDLIVNVGLALGRV